MGDCSSEVNTSTVRSHATTFTRTRTPLATSSRPKGFNLLTLGTVLDVCVPPPTGDVPLGYGFGLGPFGGPANPFGGTP